MRSLFLLSCLLPVMAIAAATPLESVTGEGSESIPQRMVSLSVKQDVAAACGTRPCRREN
ncbi:MAG: hypothetical protein IPO00_02470 [Betaproteobacteria bacterium]|nr:hypothetical protein [Betaproteobacteria bacterium]